jgi:uncharacterized protein YdaU (DUF1376 family)
MGENPWFKFYSSDWISGVSGLSAAERGVYVSLLAAMYDRSGPIPRDDARLARQCGLPKAGFTRAVEALIAESKIVEMDGMLFNERVKNELTEREKRSVTASEAATTGWEIRKEKQRSKNANAMPEQCGPNATHARVPESDIDTSLRSVSNASAKAKRDEIVEILRAAVSEETALEVIEHRKGLRKPLTAGAARRLVKAWQQHGDCEAAASEMMSRGWSGFNTEWMKNQQARGSPRKQSWLDAFAQNQFGQANGTSNEQQIPHVSENVRRLSVNERQESAGNGADDFDLPGDDGEFSFGAVFQRM